MKKRKILAVSISAILLVSYSLPSGAFLLFDGAAFQERINAFIDNYNSWKKIKGIYEAGINDASAQFQAESSLKVNVEMIESQNLMKLDESLANLRLKEAIDPLPDACETLTLSTEHTKSDHATKAIAAKIQDKVQAANTYAGDKNSGSADIIKKREVRAARLVENFNNANQEDGTPKNIEGDYLMNPDAYSEYTPDQQQAMSDYLEIMTPVVDNEIPNPEQNKEAVYNQMRRNAFIAMAVSGLADVASNRYAIGDNVGDSSMSNMPSKLALDDEVGDYFWGTPDSLPNKMNEDPNNYTKTKIMRERAYAQIVQIKQNLDNYKMDLKKEGLLAAQLLSQLEHKK